jgi:hypothetical protein
VYLGHLVDPRGEGGEKGHVLIEAGLASPACVSTRRPGADNYGPDGFALLPGE